ncbi:L-threonine kinase [Clostridium acetireducens DSM 10703]|jgi:L-threonine kinase|uniref:L-threonine kinase n=1 Tax=Clostridium acetireducens DSM 10703 TaxID=1121290 RepID=A0A1E8F0Q1_9CLOT|nr:kinase [Clostridium acetireducens]OFI06716.1 L-threonine kinase [Clostridium acetireducens DSM 10703]
MKFTAFYPGSFGEIIQGKYKGKDILLSCPINLYTKVSLYECKNPKEKFSKYKSNIFLKNILKNWGYEKYEKNLDISIKSQIPCGKGFASSTADLCALYIALTKFFNKEFNEQELVKQCIKIEPTDSIIFDKLTAFEYKKGNYKETLGDYFKFYILAFEGENKVDTIEFNKRNMPPLSNIDDLVEILKYAIKNKDIKNLALASTESIIRNEIRLKYTFLEEVLKLKNKTSGLGIIGAHSGNLLGIIYDDIEKIKNAINYTKHLNFLKVYAVNTIPI